MSKFNASGILRKRQFRYLTGVTPDIFQEMVSRLRPLWEKVCRNKNRSGRPYGVGGLDDHLFVMKLSRRRLDGLFVSQNLFREPCMI